MRLFLFFMWKAALKSTKRGCVPIPFPLVFSPDLALGEYLANGGYTRYKATIDGSFRFTFWGITATQQTIHVPQIYFEYRSPDYRLPTWVGEMPHLFIEHSSISRVGQLLKIIILIRRVSFSVCKFVLFTSSDVGLLHYILLTVAYLYSVSQRSATITSCRIHLSDMDL